MFQCNAAHCLSCPSNWLDLSTGQFCLIILQIPPIAINHTNCHSCSIRLIDKRDIIAVRPTNPSTLTLFPFHNILSNVISLMEFFEMMFPIASVTLRTSGSTCVKKSAMPLRSCSADITILSVEGRFDGFKRVRLPVPPVRRFALSHPFVQSLSVSLTLPLSVSPTTRLYTGTQAC